MIGTAAAPVISNIMARLDPENSAVHLETIARAARAIGKRLRIEMIDAAQRLL